MQDIQKDLNLRINQIKFLHRDAGNQRDNDCIYSQIHITCNLISFNLSVNKPLRKFYKDRFDDCILTDTHNMQFNVWLNLLTHAQTDTQDMQHDFNVRIILLNETKFLNEFWKDGYGCNYS